LLAALPAAAQAQAQIDPATVLKGKKVLVTGGSPADPNMTRQDIRELLQALGEGAASVVGADLASAHQVATQPFPGPDGNGSDAALAARVKESGAERLVVVLAAPQPDRRVVIVAQVFAIRLNALGALESDKLWQAATVVSFSQVVTHQLWHASTLIGYDLLDAMIAEKLVGPPQPGDEMLANALLECSAIHTANAVALKAAGEDPASQNVVVGYYRAAGEAFSSPQFAQKRVAEFDEGERTAMAKVQASPSTDAAREYLLELDSRMDLCGRYQRRHLDLITQRIEKSGLLKK
jgi:hypothetical protein